MDQRGAGPGGSDGTAVETRDEPPAPRPLTLALLGIGVLAIPVGLIFLYLALTRGDPTPKPAAGQGVVGVTAKLEAPQIDGPWSMAAGGASRVTVTATPGTGGAGAGWSLATPAVEGGLAVRGGRIQTLAVQADLRQGAAGGSVPDDSAALRRAPLVRLRFDADANLSPPLEEGDRRTVTLDGEVTVNGITRPARLEVGITARRDGTWTLTVDGRTRVTAADVGLDRLPTGTTQLDVALDLRLVQGGPTVTIARDITGGTTPGTGGAG